MIKNFVRHALTFTTVALITACATAERPETYPEITFTHLPLIRLEASSLEVVKQYQPSGRSPYVGHLSPVSVGNAVDTWAQHRLRTTGIGNNRIVVTMTEGSIKEEALPIDGGIRGAFKNEQAVKYEAVIKVSVQLVSGDGSVRAETSADVWHTQTASEDISDYETRRLWLGMIEKAINELDSKIETGLRQYFAPALRS